MISVEKANKHISTTAKYSPKKYDHLFGMKGFSDQLLSDHFKLYQGYVSNTNTALEKIQLYSKDPKQKEVELSEIRRRLGWEFNGMRLHEYYFDNLGGKESIEEQTHLYKQLNAQFEGYENWKNDFVSAGAMRGIGWVILYSDSQAGRLMNMWIDEHHTNHLAGGTPLLVMDVFEHAYMHDYGTDKHKYMESFFENIDWDVVSKRSE